MFLHSLVCQIVSQTGKHFPQSRSTVQSPFLDLTNTHNYVRETFSRMSEAQVSYTSCWTWPSLCSTTEAWTKRTMTTLNIISDKRKTVRQANRQIIKRQCYRLQRKTECSGFFLLWYYCCATLVFMPLPVPLCVKTI